MAVLAYNKQILARQQNLKGLFFKKILKMIQSDPRICFLASDALVEGNILRKAMEQYPERIIDVGIAEQNLVGIAAGLALSGKIPFVSVLAPFLPLRALEQIHTDIAYNDVPVKLISVSGGTTSNGGPTHNLICDFGIMNAIPNMTVIAPSDTKQFLAAIDKTVDYKGPVYLRMPPAGATDVAHYDDFTIGVASVVQEGDDATIIGTGSGVSSAMSAAQKLKNDNINVRVIDMHTIKPLDRQIILKAAKETHLIVTVEDHNIEGGMGTLISAVVAEAGITCKIVKLGVPDVFSVLGPGKGIAEYYGFSTEGIVNAIRAELSKV